MAEAGLARVAAGARTYTAKCEVLRDQIRARTSRQHYSTAELRRIVGQKELIGSGANQAELGRLQKLMAAVLKHEEKNPLKGGQAHQLSALPLRAPPLFPDARASRLDQDHRAAVTAAVALARQLVEAAAGGQGEFHAPRSKEPEQLRLRRKKKAAAAQQQQKQQQQHAKVHSDLDG